MAVRTAVIPAAGMGTRFLPATRAIPKELLPIYDTPAIQFVIDEAAAAGMQRVVIVTSRAKPSIEKYAASASTDKVAVSVVYQDSPLGLGHAISCARDAVAGEPFAVMLPDEIMGDSSLIKELVKLYEKTNKSSIGLKKVPPTEVSSYGNVGTSDT
ncbi:MAG: UTP--glucose-phosphate uridylyltransferase, partial [Actinomycetota bacterium]